MRWQEYRERYDIELNANGGASVRVAAAFVESAVARGGLAVLICAERDAVDFASLCQEEQDELYCHRFTRARRIGQQLSETVNGRRFEPIRLRLEDLSLSSPATANPKRSA